MNVFEKEHLLTFLKCKSLNVCIQTESFNYKDEIEKGNIKYETQNGKPLMDTLLFF